VTKAMLVQTVSTVTRRPLAAVVLPLSRLRPI
jgi:hypothetical protein